MTDEELFQQVAKIEGYEYELGAFIKYGTIHQLEAFCFRLIDKYKLQPLWFRASKVWDCLDDYGNMCCCEDKDLKRAICLAVLEMPKSDE